MDAEDEDTLVEITEPENAIEKPKKRQASEKQLAALAAAREKRKTKTNALDKAQQMRVPVPQAVAPPPPPMPVADVVVKRTKPKRVVQKPTIIQIDSESDSGDDEPPAPTIIIRNGSKKKAAQEQVTAPQVQQQYVEPRQYIRRAY